MSGGGGGGGGGLLNNPLELALVAGTAIAAPYAAPALFGEGALMGGLGIAGDSALAAGLTGAGIGGLGGAVLGYNPLQTAMYGGLGGAAASGLGIGAAAPTAGGTAAGTVGTTAGTTGAGSGLTAAGAPGITAGGGGVATYDAGLAANTVIPGAAGTAGTTVGTTAGTALTQTPPTSWFGGLSPLAKAGVIGAGGLGLSALLKNDAQHYGIPTSVTQPYTGGNLAKFQYDPNKYTPAVAIPPTPPYQADYSGYARPPGYAGGGLMDPNSEPVDFMGGDMYPQSQQHTSAYATPTQMPATAQATASLYEPKTNPLTGDEVANMNTGGYGKDALADLMGARDAIQKYKSQYSQSPSAVTSAAKSGDYNAMLAMNQLRGTPNANYAAGGMSSLGGYSDGGRMLKGPGDGMSDSIPATIANKRPARLADNEFVVPADVVSHLGNGSSDAGAKKLYAMMDKVRKARTGKKKQAPAINSDKYMPA